MSSISSLTSGLCKRRAIEVPLQEGDAPLFIESDFSKIHGDITQKIINFMGVRDRITFFDTSPKIWQAAYRSLINDGAKIVNHCYTSFSRLPSSVLLQTILSKDNIPQIETGILVCIAVDACKRGGYSEATLAVQEFICRFELGVELFDHRHVALALEAATYIARSGLAEPFWQLCHYSNLRELNFDEWNKIFLAAVWTGQLSLVEEIHKKHETVYERKMCYVHTRAALELAVELRLKPIIVKILGYMKEKDGVQEASYNIGLALTIAARSGQPALMTFLLSNLQSPIQQWQRSQILEVARRRGYWECERVIMDAPPSQVPAAL